MMQGVLMQQYFSEEEDESVLKMASLILQERMLTEECGGVFPELETSFSTIHRILDVECGPGQWVLDVARAHAEVEIIGIDERPHMIYAAHVQQWANLEGMRKFQQVSFQKVDLTRPLPFDDHSFDFVNGRLVCFLDRKDWPHFIAECKRILRPGGMVRVMESDPWGVTLSSASAQIASYVRHVLRKKGPMLSWKEDDTPLLKPFFHAAGFESIAWQIYRFDALDKEKERQILTQVFTVLFCWAQPMLVKAGVVSASELEQLYLQALADFQLHASWPHRIIWGRKPENGSSIEGR
jgi:SAM-dependent methyltransferase